MTQPLAYKMEVVSSPDPEPVQFEPAPDSVISFPDGVPGFEKCHRFVVVSPEDAQPFQYLRGLDEPRPAFLAVDPSFALKGYRRILSPADRLRFEARDDEPLLWLAIVTLGENEAAWVNLRAPLVINPRTMTGYQVMPHHSLYPIRHPLGV